MSFCIGLLAGLAAIKANVNIDIKWLIILAPVFVLLAKAKSSSALLVLILIAVVIGNFRGYRFDKSIEPYIVLDGQKVEMITVAETDAQYNDKKQLEFDVSGIDIMEPVSTSLPGKVKVSGFGESAIYKGDKLQINGKLFKTRGSRQASISYAQINLISRNPSFVDNVRRDFSTGITNVLPDPQAPFGLGLLIGQKSTLGEGPTSWLAVVGLTHIIAVSGYNLTIIVRFIHRLFGNKSRYQTLLFSSTIICLFLLTTGFSASIVRASIVCGFSLLAWFYGRKIKPMVIILLTASITAMWYPYYLWSDIGWYLSFLAFFGVLVLAPLFTKRFFKKHPKPVMSVVVETMCAQIMTAPLIMYIFGEFSTISLISNLLVVSLIPLAMLFTLVAGIAGMISPESLYILALPAKLLLSYILYVGYSLSKVPNALIEVGIPLGYMLFVYILIICFAIIIWSKTKSQRGIITDEKLI